MRQILPLIAVSLLFVACSSSKSPTVDSNTSSSSSISSSAEPTAMYHPPLEGDDCRPVARFTKTKSCPAGTNIQFRYAKAKDGFCLPKNCPVMKFE